MLTPHGLEAALAEYVTLTELPVNPAAATKLPRKG